MPTKAFPIPNCTGCVGFFRLQDSQSTFGFSMSIFGMPFFVSDYRLQENSHSLFSQSPFWHCKQRGNLRYSTVPGQNQYGYDDMTNKIHNQKKHQLKKFPSHQGLRCYLNAVRISIGSMTPLHSIPSLRDVLSGLSSCR